MVPVTRHELVQHSLRRQPPGLSESLGKCVSQTIHDPPQGAQKPTIMETELDLRSTSSGYIRFARSNLRHVKLRRQIFLTFTTESCR